MASTTIMHYQGVQKESAGYKLLASMGWKEGEGLGAAKQGIKEHIRVKKKFENWGVGAVEAAENARNWTTGMMEFHRVLSTLSEITSQHAKASGDSGYDSDTESDASDGEKDKAEKKVKAKDDSSSKSKKKKKKEKSSSKSKLSNKDKDSNNKKSKSKTAKKASPSPSTATFASSDEEDAEKDDSLQPVKRVKFATHIGRFKRRESAKFVKNYSSGDLAAILGGDPFASVAAAVTETTRQDDDSKDSSSSDSDSEDNNNEKTAVVQKQVSFASPFQQQQQEQKQLESTAAPVQPEDEGHWWSNYFMRAGRLGSIRALPKESGDGIKAHGFSEQDQTNLYNLAQDNATQGRVGLGRSSMPKKVAGARWQGKRQKLGSDDEDDEQSEEEQQQRQPVEPVEEGAVVVMPGGKVRKSAVAAPAVEASSKLEGIKWKKAVTTALKMSKKQRMKMSKLHKAIMEEHGLDTEHKDAAMVRMTEVVLKSSKFVLEEGVVRLVE